MAGGNRVVLVVDVVLDDDVYTPTVVFLLGEGVVTAVDTEDVVNLGAAGNAGAAVVPEEII
jgi:hypothetical protein